MKKEYTCIIVDDEQDALDLMVRMVDSLFADVKIVGTYKYWKDALAAVRDTRADLVLLDISMGAMNGLDILKVLPALKSEVILVTAHSEYAIDAFKVAASGYVLKPVIPDELTLAVERALERINAKREAEHKRDTNRAKIAIPNGNGFNYFEPDDIVYFEAVSNYTKVVTQTGELMSSYNLGKYQFVLENNSFFQVHRSFIINSNCVVRYETVGIAVMTNSRKVPVARQMRTEFQKALSNNTP